MLINTAFGPMYRVPCSNGGHMEKLSEPQEKKLPMADTSKENTKFFHDYDITERLDLAAEAFEIKDPPQYENAALLMEARENILHLRVEIIKAIREVQDSRTKNSQRRTN
tara:strand:+ start:65 stop:394 length:330 start_codon:yes stop_codon:yes gene_type:complete